MVLIVSSEILAGRRGKRGGTRGGGNNRGRDWEQGGSKKSQNRRDGLNAFYWLNPENVGVAKRGG